MPLKDIMFHPANNTDLIAGGGKSQVPCLRIESKPLFMRKFKSVPDLEKVGARLGSD